MSVPILDFRRLRYFRAIAKHGSFSAAARALHVAQPALTYHMNTLERGMGIRLFERLARGVRVTDAGARLLKHANSVLDEVALAEAEMRAFATGHSRASEIRLAITPALAAALTPRLLGATGRTFPETQLLISEIRTQDAKELLAKGEMDVAVTIAMSADENQIPLVWDPLILVSAGRREAAQSTIPCRDLPQERLILPTEQRTLRRQLNRMFEDLGISVNIVTEINGIDPRKQAVMAGLGSTVTSFPNVSRELAAGLLNARTIVDPSLERLIILEYRNGFDAVAVVALTDLIRTEVLAVLEHLR